MHCAVDQACILHLHVQINATEVKQMEPDMPELLRELGIKYDPDRLALVLKRRGGKVRARAIQIAAAVGAFLARILKVCANNG